MVVAKTVLNCVYNKTPLKLISFYVKEHKDMLHDVSVKGDMKDMKGRSSIRKRTSKQLKL